MKYGFLILIFSMFFNCKSPTKAPTTSLYDITLNDLSGRPISLSDYKGKYILFVNTASECGFTPQYKALQQLYETYQDKLIIIGVPCNQFGNQEPGSATEIKQFCEQNYDISFLMTEKIKVKGDNQHPLYKWLTTKALNGSKNSSVKWNFQKYLVDKNGHLVDYWYALTKPLSSKITKHLK